MMIKLKEAFRSFLMKNIQQSGVISSAAMPDPCSTPLYTGWKVTDPTTGAVTCLRVLVPFKELICGIVGMDKYLARKMPNKYVWFTFLVDQSARDYEEAIPQWDSKFIPSPEHINLLIDVLMQPNTPGYGRAYYGWGEAGAGKTSTALWLCAILRLAVIHVNCRPNMEVEEFFLSQIAVDGKWQQISGPVMEAVLRDWVLIVDELDLAPDEFWPALNNLIEGRSVAIPGYPGKRIQARSTFKIIGFGNTGPTGDELATYCGRSQIDASVLDRMFKDYYEPCTRKMFMEIILKHFDNAITDDLADRLGEFAVMVNLAVKNGDFPEMLSPRSMISLCNLFLRNEKIMRFPLLYAIGAIFGSVLCNRENRETLFNAYSMAICENAININDIKKNWADRFKVLKEEKKSSSSSEELVSESADNADNENTPTDDKSQDVA